MKYVSLKKILYYTGAVSVVILLILTTGVIELAAQSTPGPPPFPTNPDAVPIDGGLALLAAAGGGYAIKKLRDKKK